MGQASPTIRVRAVTGAVAALLLASASRSAALAPYAADANTLHLWHMDDAPSGPATGAVGGVSLAAGNGATFGMAALPGFGTSGSTGAGADAEFLSAASYAVSTVTGPDGAFTFEALVNISTTAGNQMIFGMDANSGTRPFQFRISDGQLMFINITPVGGQQNLTALIPTTGSDAFVANEWFHVAVTYKGTENTNDNCKMYWTRADASRTAANEIGSFKLVGDIAGSAKYGVGNFGRTTGDQNVNLEGRIDEVRISSIARDSHDFLFFVPDSDGDGLADLWEILHFRATPEESDAVILAKYDGDDDPDLDGFDNEAEESAGSDPNDTTNYPLVSYIPVTDENSATDENGYAGSAINSIAFAQNNLITIGGQQFISYYRRHATDPNQAANNTVVVARRTLGESRWEVFPTSFTSFNINDTHNVISMAIDGDGVIHMSWGMHVNTLLYARSSGPVLGEDPIVMTSVGTAGMTGQDNGVTYPKFQTLPDGDVIFLFREGGSGNGDWYLNRYDTDTDTWSPVHANGSGVKQPLMLGRGDSPDNCFYPDRLTLGPDGMLHLAGVFRYNSDSPAGQSGYQTNHRYVYLRSPDGGTTWQRSDGSAIALPVVEAAWFQNRGAAHVPEIVKDLAEGHSIMNESGMTTDSAGRPIIANWWAENAFSGNHTRQYHILFHDGSQWNQRTVSARVIDNPATRFSEAQLGASRMGRPVVLTDADDRIIIIYNDNRFDGITVVFSLPLARDPGRNQWTRMNLTHENLGSWETTYDETRWKQDGVLHMLYQKLPGMGMSYSPVNNSTPVSVVEWDARAYFNSPIRWAMDTGTTPGQAKISAQTRTGFRYHLKTGTDLFFADPPAASVPGDGEWWDFGSWPMNESRRFWRVERIEESTNDL